MKKFLAIVLALAMLGTVCSIGAFAATNAATVSLEISANPATNGFVAAPAQAGDMFELAVKLSDLDTDYFVSGQVVVSWDSTKLQPVRANGTAANAATGYIRGSAFPTYSLDEETGEESGVFDWNPGLETGVYDITATINTASEYFTGAPQNANGYPVAAGTTELEFFKIRFKVLEEGDTGLAITKVNLFITDKNAPATINIVPANIVIGGSVVEPSTVIASIDSEVPAEVESAEQLPKTVDVTLTDGVKKTGLAVTWSEPDKDGVVTGTIEGYTFADGVTLTSKVLPKVEPSTVIASIDSEVPAEVESAEQLPATVEVTLTDGVKKVLAVTWSEPDENNVVTGTIEGYTFAEGVTLTSKIKDQDPGPGPGEDDKIVDVEIPENSGIPEKVKDSSELPETITITVVYGNGEKKEITVSVEWEYNVFENAYTAKSIKDEDGNEITDVDLSAISVKGVSNALLNVEAVQTESGKAISIKISRNEDYVEGDGSTPVDPDEMLYAIASLFRCDENGVVIPDIVEAAGFSFTLSQIDAGEFSIPRTWNVEFEAVTISIVQGFDSSKPISADNLGAAVAEGVTVYAD